ncbi:hypothetical protein PIB30_060535 [Stylosanthes scabra]|uniref:Uncharacterized protein n=1 Tax=Stylosanthes scabra TaxID=79078 RepID=A0ABU6YI31_9FABA|nr:hypothetical protein [Stylosanthes scabra]
MAPVQLCRSASINSSTMATSLAPLDLAMPAAVYGLAAVRITAGSKSGGAGGGQIASASFAGSSGGTPALPPLLHGKLISDNFWFSSRTRTTADLLQSIHSRHHKTKKNSNLAKQN